MKKHKSKPTKHSHHYQYQSKNEDTADLKSDKEQQRSKTTNVINPNIKSGLKYVYLFTFFLFLSGFFHPLIYGTSLDKLLGGTLVLFVGLIGGILLYKATISENNTMVLFLGSGGFGLIIISLFYIFVLTGRLRF